MVHLWSFVMLQLQSRLWRIKLVQSDFDSNIWVANGLVENDVAYCVQW